MTDQNKNVDMKATPRTRLLLVDDDRYLTEALGANLEARLFDVRTANSTRQGLMELTCDSYDAAVVDWLMPDGNGATLLNFAKSHFPEMPVIVYSAHEGADAQSVVSQADDFVLKGGSEEQLFHTLDRVLQAAKRSRASCACSQPCGQQRLTNLFQPLRKMFGLPERLGNHVGFLVAGFWDADGLQCVVADSTAAEEERSFAFIDCARTDPEALERKLFGYVDLSRPHLPELERGILERIRGGRLALLNADRLALKQQERLSQSFRSGNVRRAGSERDIPIRARLAVFIPESKGMEAVRKRLSPELTSLIDPDWYDPARQWNLEGGSLARLVQRMLDEAGGHEAHLGAAARWLLAARGKTLSLGELANAIERASSHLSSTDKIEVEDLALPWCSSFISKADLPGLASLDDATATFESLYMVRVLSETEGNVSKAVEIAGIGRPAFYSRLRKYKIEPDAFRPNALNAQAEDSRVAHGNKGESSPA